MNLAVVKGSTNPAVRTATHMLDDFCEEHIHVDVLLACADDVPC